MSDPKETTGKAMDLVLASGNIIKVNPATIVEMLLANPEARMAVLELMPEWQTRTAQRDALAFGIAVIREKVRVRALASTEAVTDALEALRIQALSASTPSPAVPADSSVATSGENSDGAGAVEATAGEAPIEFFIGFRQSDGSYRYSVADEPDFNMNGYVNVDTLNIHDGSGPGAEMALDLRQLSIIANLLAARISQPSSIGVAPTAESCDKCGSGPHDPCDRGVDHSEPAPVAEAPERDHGGAGGGDEDGYNMLLAAGGGTHRDVRNYLHRLSPDYLGKPIMETLLAYVDKQEAAEREAGELRKGLETAKSRRVTKDDFYHWWSGLTNDERVSCWYDLDAMAHGEVLVALKTKLSEAERKLEDNNTGWYDRWNRDQLVIRNLNDDGARLLAKVDEAERKLADACKLAEKWLSDAADIRADGDGAHWTHVAEAHEDCSSELSSVLEKPAAQEPTGGEPAKPPATIKLREPTQSRMPAGGVLLLDERPEVKPPAPASQFKVGQPVRLTCKPHKPLATSGRIEHIEGVRAMVRIDYDHTRHWVDFADLELAEDEPADPTPTSTEGPSPFVTRAELVAALRSVGKKREPDVYTGAEVIAIVARELEREGGGKS